jgi:hypothetical protein
VTVGFTPGVSDNPAAFASFSQTILNSIARRRNYHERIRIPCMSNIGRAYQPNDGKRHCGRLNCKDVHEPACLRQTIRHFAVIR